MFALQINDRRERFEMWRKMDCKVFENASVGNDGDDGDSGSLNPLETASTTAHYGLRLVGMATTIA